MDWDAGVGVEVRGGLEYLVHGRHIPSVIDDGAQLRKGRPMALSFAIDELIGTGWTGLDSAGCGFDTDGRAYPSALRVRQEFSAAGFEFDVARHEQYNCFRATWREAGETQDAGAVVGHSEAEAAVYALAQLRRSVMATA